MAYDLFNEAKLSENWEAIFLAAIPPELSSGITRVGAAITRFDHRKDEFLFTPQHWDSFYHVVLWERGYRAIINLIEDFRPDVIHVHHSLFFGLDVLELIRIRFPDIKLFYTLHEYLPICLNNGHLVRVGSNAICHKPTQYNCMKCFPNFSEDLHFLRKNKFLNAFSLVDRFIAPSEYLKTRFVNWGLDADRIEIIPNGDDTKPISPEAVRIRSKSCNNFGFFGQNVDAKGVDILIEAAIKEAAASDREIILHIFGGSRQYASQKHRQRIEELLSDLPKNLKAVEHGAYDRTDIGNLMTKVDWVVVPSIWPETFVLVVSEAWATGRPVIASNSGALSHRIKHDYDGLLTQTNNVESLRATLSHALGNGALWDRLNKNIEPELTTAAAWKRHEALFKSLVN